MLLSYKILLENDFSGLYAENRLKLLILDILFLIITGYNLS